MSWLDAFFFGYSVQVLGVPFPHENVLNFTGAVVGTDDVANGRTTVNVTGGGGGGGITALTGDVTASGSGSVAATVAGIQGNPVSSTPPIAAQLLVENSGATGSAWTTVSGDSTLSATGAMVNTAVHGATVPAAGSLTTGNVLQVSGASALTYGAVNLAGGAGYVTGALPAGNIAPGSGDQLLETNHAGVTAWFSPGGDLTLASNSFAVVSLAGSSGTTVANSSVTPGTDNTYTAGTAAKRWASISAVTYNVFAASGDTVAASALTAGALTLGVGGSTAVDTRLHRTAAHVLTLDNNSTGGASLLVGGTAAYVTISQAAMTPSADNAYTIGSATDRLTSISSIEYDVYHASADTNPSCRQGDGFVSFGVGGSTALDTRITRTAAKTLTLDDGAGGTSGVELFVGGTVATQLGITGQGLTFGVGATPLVTQTALATDVAATDTTIRTQAAFAVALAGTFNTQNGSNAVSSTQSGVVSAGQVVVFGNQNGTAYTISTWSGTSGTLGGNFTGTTNTTNTATRISATAANQYNGSLTIDFGTLWVSATTAGPYLKFQSNGNVWGAIGPFAGAQNLDAALYLRSPGASSLTPGATNYTLASDGSATFVNAPTGILHLQSAGVDYASLNSATLLLTAPLLTWVATVAPTINVTARGSTSMTNGAAGAALTIAGAAGQAATGASNNGGKGGNLALSGGVGGTSGSATAGIGGLVTQFCGQAWQQITITASTYSVDTNSTTSDLVIFTDSTSNTVTITLPAPSAGRLIYVKDKTGKAATHNVTISQHASETIDGASSLTLSKNYDAVLLISDGTNWSIIGEYAGSII